MLNFMVFDLLLVVAKSLSISLEAYKKNNIYIDEILQFTFRQSAGLLLPEFQHGAGSAACRLANLRRLSIASRRVLRAAAQP